jgi:hypothetical protein
MLYSILVLVVHRSAKPSTADTSCILHTITYYHCSVKIYRVLHANYAVLFMSLANVLLLHTLMMMIRLVCMPLKSGVQMLLNNHGNVWVHIYQIEVILLHGSCGVSSNELRDDCSD